MSLNPFKHNKHPPSSPARSDLSTMPQPPSTPQSARLKSEFDGDRGMPPSYSSSTSGGDNKGKDDDRPLPDGWVKQWNDQYKRWFYVDTKASGGPRSIWTHPLDDPIYKAQLSSSSSYHPPTGPPPPQGQQGDSRGFFGHHHNQPPPQQGGYYGNQPSYGGYGGPPPQQGYYGGPPPQQGYYGGPPPQQYYQPYPQQAPVQQAPQRSSGVNPLLLGGGALLGGLVLGDMIGDAGDGGGDGGDWGGGDGGGDGGFF